jgi:membrane protein DedA with SNARE-associated domain/membrane-associated phospholipid phosphatase
MSSGQVLAAVAAAALAVAAILGRRRGKVKGERFVLSLLGAIALAVYASGVLSGLPDAKKLIEDLADALGEGTYALVGVMAFLETGAFVGLIAPGEFTVIVGGVIAGQGQISVLLLLGIVWLCCVLGDTASFFIGRRLGRSFLERHGPRFKISHARLAQVDEYFASHGGKTILIGRFIGIVRAVAPSVAGSSGLAYRRFIPFSIIGTGLWGSFYTLLGYLFYQSFDKVAGYAGRATFVFACLVGLVVGIVWTYRRLRVEENRRRLMAWFDRQGRRPLLRPLAVIVRPAWRHIVVPGHRVLAPRVRFVWERLTPGELGLELTTALAVAGVGLYAFVAYTNHVVGHLAPTALDNRVIDLADETRTSVGVEVAKVVTAFGSLPVTAGLVALGAVLLVMKRRPVELAVLVLSALTIYAAVHITKAAVDRPRPPHPLASSTLSAFPSGHAAYSTVYVAMAVVAARVVDGLSSRAALIVAAVVAAGAIGVSRAYLRVHWWSDVVTGWALGAAIFGTLGAIGVVVDHIRHNGMAEPAVATAGTGSDRGPA